MTTKAIEFDTLLLRIGTDTKKMYQAFHPLISVKVQLEQWSIKNHIDCNVLMFPFRDTRHIATVHCNSEGAHQNISIFMKLLKLMDKNAWYIFFVSVPLRNNSGQPKLV